VKTNVTPIPPERVAAWLARHPDASPVEWDEDGGHFDGVRLADGQTFHVSTCYRDTDANRAATVAAAALQTANSETTTLAGIQLNADPIKRSKSRPIEECKSLKPQTGAAATHVLHTTINGVRVKLLAIVDDED
jgi:hypothetical protein